MQPLSPSLQRSVEDPHDQQQRQASKEVKVEQAHLTHSRCTINICDAQERSAAAAKARARHHNELYGCKC